MKLLIAFALFAVAFAADEVRVVRLPEARAPAIEQVDIRPLIVPQSVLDALKTLPVSLNVDDALRVMFVDAPIELEEAKAEIPEQDVVVAYSSDVSDVVEPFAVDDESLKVRFVDAPIELEEAKAEVPEQDVVVAYSSDVSDVVEPFAVDDESWKVRFVDAPIELEQVKADVPEQDVIIVYSSDVFDAVDDESLKVRFVDAPIELEEAKAEIPEQDVVVAYSSDVSDVVEPFAVDDESLKVKFVDAPIQAEFFDAVKIAEPVFKSVVPSVDTVKVIDALRLGKLFADPRLR